MNDDIFGQVEDRVKYHYLSAGQLSAEDFFNYPVTTGKLVSRYYELWTRNVIAKVCLSSELDVAYGYSKVKNEVRGFRFERYHEGTHFLKRIKDPSISHVYFKMFEEPTARGIPITFVYLYLAKVSFNDEIICMQKAEEIDGTPIYLPLSFKHTEEELVVMWFSTLSMRYNIIYD